MLHLDERLPGRPDPPMKRVIALSCAAACGAFVAASSSLAAPAFEYLDKLGLYDAAHTDADGSHESILSASSYVGWFAGVSTHYVGTVEGTEEVPAVNQTGWTYSPWGETARPGLYYGKYQTSSGGHDTRILGINTQGMSYGNSVRFDPTDRPRGVSAWWADRNGTTIPMGLTPITMNEAGLVAGQYENAPDQAAIFFITGWIQLGRQDIAPYWYVHDMNESGATILNATSKPDASGARQGAGAWFCAYRESPVRIGLTGPDYTHPTDGDTNMPLLLSDTGYVAGIAAKGPGWHAVAWLRAPDGTTRQLGEDYAYADFTPRFLNNGGYVIGTTTGPNPGQESYWVQSPQGEPRRIGVYDSDHTLGRLSFNTVERFTDSGFAIGNAGRVGPMGRSGPGSGQDAFVAWRGGSTRLLALTDATHLRDDGYRFSTAEGVTESGFVWGSSARYGGTSSAKGQTAWIYDCTQRTMQPLVFSVRPCDGYAWSKVTKVLKNGTALGYYTRFVGNTDTGMRAFAWVPGQGFLKIDVSMDVAIRDAGWQYFQEAQTGTRDPWIAGAGRLDEPGYSQGVFLVKLNATP